MTAEIERADGLTTVRVLEKVMPQPAMSGQIREVLAQGMGVALFLEPGDADTFQNDIPAEEWGVRVTERTWGAGRPRTMTLLIPEDCGGDAQIMYYQPTPARNRAEMARHDWTGAEPSPNCGLLAYWINNRMTAISVPMMVKEGVRHNFCRRLFVELNDAPDWLQPMHYHNNPGLEIAKERELVEELRAAMRT